MPDDREDNDKSIANALSALGWVEEIEETEEPVETDKDITIILKEQIKLLNEKVNKTIAENEKLIK